MEEGTKPMKEKMEEDAPSQLTSVPPSNWKNIPTDDWTRDNVFEWVKDTLKKYGDYAETAANILKNQLVTGSSLITLTKDDLLKVGIPLGPASDLAQAIEKLKPTGKQLSVVYDEILDTLNKHPQIQQYIQQPNLIVYQKYFEPNKNHPFYEEICKAQIPLDKDQPSLLLHNLPPHVPKSLIEMFEKGKRKRNESDVDIEGISDSEEEGEIDDDMKVAQQLHSAARSILEKSSKLFSEGQIGNSLVLIGVSGCSKTRTLYEVLCCRMGLYFTCSVGGNGGSNDMQMMMTNLQEEIVSRQNTDVEEIGNRHVNALLLGRLILLQYLINKMSVSPFLWLMLQIKSPKLLCGVAEDLFSEIYQKLCLCNSFELGSKIRDLLTSISGQFKAPLFIATDEAHLLLKVCEDKFAAVQSQGSTRSLFSKLVNQWTKTAKTVLLIAGTGLRLREANKYVASATYKNVKAQQEYLIVDFGGYYQLKHFGSYLEVYFGKLSDATLQPILDFIKGRYRYSAEFVRRVLTDQRQWSKDEIFRGQLTDMKEHLQSKGHDDDQTSPRYWLAQIKDGKKPNIVGEGRSPLEIIRQLTCSYYLLGTGFTFTSASVLSLVEMTICPLSRTMSGSLKACIAEPLTAWACYCFFRDYKYPIEEGILELMGEVSILPTTCGLLIEKYLIPSIIADFLKYDTIDQHPYFAQWTQFLPSWFKGAKWILPHWKEGEKWLGYSRKTFDLLEYLQNPQDDLFVPDNLAKHDAVGRVLTTTGDIHLAIMQFKLHSYEFTTSQLVAALDTTDYHNAYSGRAMGKQKREAKQKCQKLMEQGYHAQEGTLRIVFYHPPASQDVCNQMPPTVTNKDIIVFFTKDSNYNLFGEKSNHIWKFIHDLQQSIEN